MRREKELENVLICGPSVGQSFGFSIFLSPWVFISIHSLILFPSIPFSWSRIFELVKSRDESQTVKMHPGSLTL